MKCCHLTCDEQATHEIHGPGPYSDSYGCDKHVDELTPDGGRSFADIDRALATDDPVPVSAKTMRQLREDMALPNYDHEKETK